MHTCARKHTHVHTHAHTHTHTHTHTLLLVSLPLLGCRAGCRPVDLRPVSVASPSKGKVATLTSDYPRLVGAGGDLAIDGRTWSPICQPSQQPGGVVNGSGGSG